ncbi:hypothetical protein V6768_22095 [Tistrella mobilis]
MLMRRIEAALARAGAAAGLYGLAGLVLLGAAGFGVAAFYIWIDGITWHPASPALWTALLLAVIGLLMMGVGRVVLRAPKPPVRQQPSAAGSSGPPGAADVAAMTGVVSELIRRNPAEGVTMAALAGVAIGASPEIRRILADAARAALAPKPPSDDRQSRT